MLPISLTFSGFLWFSPVFSAFRAFTDFPVFQDLLFLRGYPLPPGFRSSRLFRLTATSPAHENFYSRRVSVGLPKRGYSMDKFIVSARKYRPQNFSTVVGQSHITTTLKNAIRNNQLAHAFLFCGPRGVGKTTCARILAKAINCEHPQSDGEACNECHSCVSFNEGVSLNIHELDAASNNSVDDIRTLVEQVRFAPQAGKYKVYIIDEVHMLSSSAFNAFLKTLEEPPPYAIFILATTEKHKILPTILSRCQLFDFKRITTLDTVEHLQEICDKESIRAERPALQLIAQKSEGCMRDALSILDKIVSFTNGELSYQNTLEHLNILDADYYFRLLEAMLQQDLAGALLLFEDINRKGFEGDLVLNGFAEFIRNLLVCRDERTASLLEVVESFKDRYIDFSKRAGTAYLISALNVLNEAELAYKAARNKRLHVEMGLIKLCYLQQALRLTGEAEGGVKKKLNEDARPVAWRNIPAMEPVRATGNDPSRGITTERQATKPEDRPQKEDAVVKNDTAIPGSRPFPEGVAKKNAGVGTDTGAKLLVETEPERPPRQPAAGVKPATSLGSLSSIRQQFSGGRSEDQLRIKELSPEGLRQAWDEYTQKLREEKNPAVQSFLRAILEIQGVNLFEVVTSNNLEMKFIEQEKRTLSEYLQNAFNNKTLSFSICIRENPETEEPVEKQLNKREQFLQIVEQYPLVKELKDRLKLELDY
ncbi:MAG: DNA polymerase III subunit gamma/tau [Puia sp.]|nr:DNA polymerase III subunit gamma/tau [Puia sp.]